MTDSTPATAAYCCRHLPDGTLDGPCTWPETDCYENGPAMPPEPTTTAADCPACGAQRDRLRYAGRLIEAREVRGLAPRPRDLDDFTRARQMMQSCPHNREADRVVTGIHKDPATGGGRD